MLRAQISFEAFNLALVIRYLKDNSVNDPVYRITRFGPNRVAADMEEMENSIFWRFLKISKANMASEQPRRSDLTSDLEFVAQMAYVTMFVMAV